MISERKVTDLAFEDMVQKDPCKWCDPMLTGPNAVVGEVVDCRPIEAVLRATKERIMEGSTP